MTVEAKVIQNNKTVNSKAFLDFVARKRWIIPLVLIALYAVVFTILFPDVFATPYNISAVLLEFSIPSMLIIGMAMQLINGEIDLSVGYAAMFANMVAGLLVILRAPLIVSILAPIIITSLIGLCVGTLVAKVGVNSFIATLGSGLLFYGLGLWLFELGYSIGTNNAGLDLLHLPPEFTAISKFELIKFSDGGALQLPILYAAVLLILFTYLMSKSRFFRNYYYIGMNKEAAKLSGIKVPAMKTLVFVISAAFAALSGVLMAARMGSCTTTLGDGMELRAITAVVIGGISFKGGLGTMGGAILGGLFIICLNNGLRIAEAPSSLYKVIEGGILLLAVILDAMFSKRKVVG